MAQPEQPRGILQLTGSDRHSFLSNLITNEINSEGLHYAALLNPQGKYIADFFVLVKKNEILLRPMPTVGNNNIYIAIGIQITRANGCR